MFGRDASMLPYWYAHEAFVESWSVRTLRRNISSQYYFLLLQSQNKQSVKQEMQCKTAEYQKDKSEFIKNPVVAEFLGLAPNLDFNSVEFDGIMMQVGLNRFKLSVKKWSEIYANEAELINYATLGYTSKQWSEEHPDLVMSNKNHRDYLPLEGLIVLDNMQSFNSYLMS